MGCPPCALALIFALAFPPAHAEIALYWNTGDIGQVQDIIVADANMDGVKETIVGCQLGYTGVSPFRVFNGVSKILDTSIMLDTGYPNKIQVTDIDGDGDTEIIVGSTTSWEEGAEGHIYIYDGSTYSLEWKSENIGTVVSLHVADFDLDGVNEIFAGIWRAAVQQDFGRILIFDGISHAIEFDTTLETHYFFSEGSTVCDLDNDSALEIIFVETDVAVSDSSKVFMVDRTPNSVEWKLGASSVFRGTACGDVDNDNQIEFVICHTTGTSPTDIRQVKVFDSNWVEEWSYDFSDEPFWGPTTLAMGNVDGDQIPEIAVAVTTMTFGGYACLIDRQTDSIIWSTGPGGSIDVVTFADVNNDGWLELCIGYTTSFSSGYMEVYEILDLDDDGIPNTTDNCPMMSNPDQIDTDTDGKGDACDNCPNIGNADQMNSDNDSYGDICDNCPTANNQGQEDSDDDTFGDACDNCPNIANSGQEDSDSDNKGNLCDNCPDQYNPLQEDYDLDGIGDSCDPCNNFMFTMESPGDTVLVQFLHEFSYYPTITDPDDASHSVIYPEMPHWCTVINDTLKGTAPDTAFVEPVTVIAMDACNVDTLLFVTVIYLCGDANGDGFMNILDITFLINYLYRSGAAPDPIESGDGDGGGSINLLDIVYLINYLYKGGPAPNCP